MDVFANFLTNYSAPLIWILSSIIFLGFLKGFYTVAKSVWKFFKRGVYDI